MDYAHFLNEVKTKSDHEVQQLAMKYGLPLTSKEIRGLRPLLDHISFHWLFTGVPDSFISKVESVLGKEKTDYLFRKYMDTI